MVGDGSVLTQVVQVAQVARVLLVLLPVLLAAVLPVLPVLPVLLATAAEAGVGTPTGIRLRDQTVAASTGCFPGYSWWSRS